VNPSASPLVEVRHLVRSFGDKRAVDDVSFTIAQGEVFGLLGPNGAGKTTTIRVLTMLLRPTSGEVRIAGQDVTRAGARLRRRLGYVPQGLSADGSLTGRENLLVVAKLFGLPAAVREQRIADLLALLNLEEAADRLVRTYSGGMVRRLEIGQAVLHRPELLVLDEPTVGLDPTARQSIWRMLEVLREETGMTVLVTTHYMDEADASCSRVAIMNRGRIAAIGRPAELKATVGGAEATLDDVFTAVTGDVLESGGTYRDLRQLGRRQRLG
jgi:ABC-2 type transport system ATP-binding protein